MHRLFLGSLGYPKDLDLAELEIGLEADTRLEAFEGANGAQHGVRHGRHNLN
jgi:hypothetical protein